MPSGGGYYPGVDPDGQGGLQVAGQVEATSVKIGQLLTSGALTLQDLIVAFSLNIGDPADTTGNPYLQVNGPIYPTETPALVANGSDLIQIGLQSPVEASGGTRAIDIVRSGSIASHDYIHPVLSILDSIASASNTMEINKQAGTGVALQIKGNIGSGDYTVHSLGAYSGKALPIYDESNVLLGYIPIYA